MRLRRVGPVLVAGVIALSAHALAIPIDLRGGDDGIATVYVRKQMSALYTVVLSQNGVEYQFPANNGTNLKLSGGIYDLAVTGPDGKAVDPGLSLEEGKIYSDIYPGGIRVEARGDKEGFAAVPTPEPTVPTPEPASWLLLAGSMVVGFGLFRRKFKK